MIRLAHEWYDLERKNIYDELWGWGYKLDEFMMKNNIFMFDPYIFYFYEELWKLRKSSI